MWLWLFITAMMAMAYWAGWIGCRFTQVGERMRDVALADKFAESEYNRGFKDGMGVANGEVSMPHNHAVCCALAGHRINAGGMSPHE